MNISPESLIHPWESQEQFIAANDAVRIDRDSRPLSFPDLSSAETGDSSDNTILRFIFWAHVVQNQRHAIPLIEGCDILAMEHASVEVYEDVSDRQRIHSRTRDSFDELSILVTGKIEPKTGQRLKKRGIDPEQYLRLSSKQRDRGIQQRTHRAYRSILTHFAGQLEGLVELDLTHKDARQFAALKDESKRHEDALHEAVWDLGSSWSQLETHALSQLRAISAGSLFRERLSKRQLDEVARKNPGKTIGILYGSSHQVLTRQIETPGVSLQRQFAGNDYKLPPLDTRHLGLRTSLENSLRAGVYSQEQLDQYIAVSLAQCFCDRKTSRMIDTLNDEQLSEMAGQLKSLWQEPLPSDAPDIQKRIVQRREQTRALLKNFRGSRSVLGLMKRHNS